MVTSTQRDVSVWLHGHRTIWIKQRIRKGDYFRSLKEQTAINNNKKIINGMTNMTHSAFKHLEGFSVWCNDGRFNASDLSVTTIASPCTNKTVHGWEEGSHSDCCTESELQHYTKLWHLFGQQLIILPNITLVSKISAWILQHTDCDTDNTSI